MLKPDILNSVLNTRKIDQMKKMKNICDGSQILIKLNFMFLAYNLYDMDILFQLLNQI